MKYCFNSKRDFPGEDVYLAEKYCREKNISIYYSKEDNSFADKDGNVIDISGMIIYPKDGVHQENDMCDAIVRRGGIPLCTSSDNNYVDDWPKHYQTKRKMEVLTGRDLLNKDVCNRIRQEYGNRVFFKTLFKNYSEIIKVDYLLDHESLLARTLKAHQDDEFIISEVVEIKKDELGKLEYRVFVIDGRVKSVSRMTDGVFHKINSSTYHNIFELVQSLTNFPNSYVVDVFEYIKDGISYFDVVEFNSLPAAGTYLYNSIIDLSEDNILHDDIYKISLEKRPYIDTIKQKNVKEIKGKPSKYFEDPRSFAYDLIGVYTFGSAGGLHFDAIKKVESEDLGMHGCLLQGLTLNEVPNDDYSDSDSEILTDSDIFKKKRQNNKEE